MNSQQATNVASEILQLLNVKFPNVEAEQSPDGKGVSHLKFMAYKLTTDTLMSRGKVMRWLGYLQAALIYESISDLETEKERSRFAVYGPKEA